MNKQLEKQKKKVDKATAECTKMLQEIDIGTKVAINKKKLVGEKSEEVEEQKKIIVVEQAEAEESLAEALPALEAARLALADLDKNDITEIR